VVLRPFQGREIFLAATGGVVATLLNPRLIFGSPSGCYFAEQYLLHNMLHKIEGDHANSRYWYRHANQMAHVADEPRAELAAIQAELQSRKGA
jgi:hypothetical protein